MDTSKEYIKMCDCEEIQKEWKPQSGNFVFDEHCCKDSFIFHNHPLSIYAVWLPQQDQLQEIIIKQTKVINWRNLQNCFYDWVIDCNEERMYNFDSMEQMWLAHYMEIKHNKTWDGNKWI